MAIINAGGGGGLEPLIEVLLNEKKLAQEKERIGLAKKDFELRAETAQAEQQRQRDMAAGAQAAASVLLMQRPELASTVQGLRPGSIAPFLQGLQEFQLGREQVTQAGLGTTRLGSETRVQTATEGAQIDTAQTRAAREGVALETDRANLTNINVRNQILTAKNENDPERFANAINAWISSDGALTAGDAFEAAGAKLGSIDPKLRYAPPTSMGADQSRAVNFLPLLQEAQGNINALNESGVRMSFPGSLQQATRLGSVDAVLNFVQDPEQRQLIQANRAFADYYRFSLSGQQSGEGERLAMMLSITEQFGDDDATIAQKRRLRETMINTVRATAQGGISATDAARSALRVAEQLGDENVTSAFQTLLEDAEAMESGAGVSNLPSEGNLSDVEDLINAGIGRR